MVGPTTQPLCTTNFLLTAWPTPKSQKNAWYDTSISIRGHLMCLFVGLITSHTIESHYQLHLIVLYFSGSDSDSSVRRKANGRKRHKKSKHTKKHKRKRSKLREDSDNEYGVSSQSLSSVPPVYCLTDSDSDNEVQVDEKTHRKSGKRKHSSEIEYLAEKKLKKHKNHKKHKKHRS